MTFATDIVLSALKQYPDAITSAELARDLGDTLDKEAVYFAVSHLRKTGRIVRSADKLPIPAELRSKGSHETAWGYRLPTESEAAELAIELAPDPEPEPITPATALRLMPAETGRADEWPGDAAAGLPTAPQYDPDAVAFKSREARDPTISEIEREGYALMASIRASGPIQQIETLLPRAEAGVPFIGQAMPRYATVIAELCAAVREAVNAEHREAA